VQSGVGARLTTAITPSTTLVSLTAFRKLDYEFLVDGDITELNVLGGAQRERQHQLSEEITISHQRPGLSWVAGMFLFDESISQRFGRSTGQENPGSARPARRRDQSCGFWTGDRRSDVRLSVIAGVRYTHEGKDIENAAAATALTLRPSRPRNDLRVFRFHHAQRMDTEGRPRNDAARRRSTYVSATRGFKSGGFNPSSTAPGRGYAPEWAWSYEAWIEEPAHGRARQAGRRCLLDGLHEPAGADADFDWRLRYSKRREATIRGVEVETTSRIGRGIEAGGHVTWLDARYGPTSRSRTKASPETVEASELNNAPEWAGASGSSGAETVGRARRFSIAADATGQSTVYYTPFNDDIQRQTPYGLLGARLEYGPGDRRWAIAAYSRNLTNTDYITATFGTAPTAFGGRPGPQRQFAVEFTVRK
jgi:iron complex outermembrane receptor protein